LMTDGDPLGASITVKSTDEDINQASLT
jgi:hypothetical protein